MSISDNLIFTRVADTTVSASNKVIKNGVAASNGYSYFNKNSDILIGTTGYNFSSIYTFEVKNYDEPSNTVGKTFYIRSPSSSKLTQASILSQISQQLSATPGTWEFQCSKNGATEGYYSFNIKINGQSVFGANTDEAFFTSLAEGTNGQMLAEAINESIHGGSNATCTVKVLKSFSSINNTTYVRAADDIPGLPAEGINKSFYLSIDNANNNEGGLIHRIQITLVDGDTYATVTQKLNAYLKDTYGVEVVFEEGNEEVGDFGDPNYVAPKDSQFLFIRKSKGETKSVEILGLNWDGRVVPADPELISTDDDLFAAIDTATGADNIPFWNGTGISLVISDKENKENRVLDQSILDNIVVSYNTHTRSIIISTVEVGEGHSIALVSASHGKYLLQANISGWENPSLVQGQDALDIYVYKSPTTKSIVFETKESLETPTIKAASASPANTIPYYDLVLLLNGVTEAQGTSFVEASYRDIIVITTLDKGSGTTGIQVRKYSVVNPLTGNLKYGIEVWDNGVLKETFDDISLVYADIENRFDTRINNTSENGGSSLINIEVIKNNFADSNVQFEDGTYSIGAPDKPSDIAKDTDTAVYAYTMYDYMVGNDGIPEDGDSLFEEQLDIEGNLSNIDLYNFHILITPDNISSAVQDAAITLAEKRKDFIYLVDPPFGLSTKSVIDWHNGKGFGRGTAIDSTYAALYWPWVKVYDNDNKRYSWVPPSTMMANKLVTLDNTKGCWFAPAGESNGRFNVGDIEYSAKQTERDDLYTNYNRVNPIIKYNDGSIIIFGEKTMHRENSTLTKVHTRRMVVDLKKKIRAALRPYLFLPNISSNWSKCSALINSILEIYKVGGGITYYKVTIDSTTTTGELQQQDIMMGIVNIVPAGVIEQIELEISLDKSAESVSVNG
ncbi:MAG: phage tail sheath subtilisin-like domain-containing protein [Elusimicrobiota bacterium]|nr:phage tail sheath subtilisin-like domain-containing protein [Elusimicrobiota bacterium]